MKLNDLLTEGWYAPNGDGHQANVEMFDTEVEIDADGVAWWLGGDGTPSKVASKEQLDDWIDAELIDDNIYNTTLNYQSE